MCLAVPGKILSVSGDEPLQRMGRVSFGGIVKEVSPLIRRRPMPVIT
jgi:hydrogenase expression/formation protein HypC